MNTTGKSEYAILKRQLFELVASKQITMPDAYQMVWESCKSAFDKLDVHDRRNVEQAVSILKQQMIQRKNFGLLSALELLASIAANLGYANRESPPVGSDEK